MNMIIFQKLSKKLDEFDICQAAIKEGNAAAKDILTGINSRIAATRSYTDDRIKVLEKELSGSSINPTMRQMYEKEKAALETVDDKPTTIEAEAFSSALAQMRQAVTDCRNCANQLHGLFDQAATELKKCRAATIGSFDSQLAQNWIAGLEHEFQAIS